MIRNVIALSILLTALTADAEDFPKKLVKQFMMALPSAGVAEVEQIVVSEAIPHWAVPQRVIRFEKTKELTVPPLVAQSYPFPHGLTFKCTVPYPTAIEVAYRPKDAADEETTYLEELTAEGERSKRMYNDGYYLVQWLGMEPNDSGTLIAHAIIAVVPPKEWRGRTEPGPTGAEGLEFFIRDVSLNERYYEKKYKGPGEPKSTPFIFTLTIGRP